MHIGQPQFGALELPSLTPGYSPDSREMRRYITPTSHPLSVILHFVMFPRQSGNGSSCRPHLSSVPYYACLVKVSVTWPVSLVTSSVCLVTLSVVSIVLLISQWMLLSHLWIIFACIGIASLFWISFTTGYSPTVGKCVVIALPPLFHCLLYSTWVCFPDSQWMARHVALTCHPSSLLLAFSDSRWMAHRVAHDYKYHRTGYCRYHRQTCYSPDSR